MKNLICAALFIGLFTGAVVADVCPEKAADAALVEAGLDPAASAVHTIKELGQFAVPLRFNTSRQAIARTEPDANGNTQLIYKYSQRRVRDKPAFSLSFEFLMPSPDAGCAKPIFVIAKIADGGEANSLFFETDKLRELISGDSPHVNLVDLGDGLLRLDRVKKVDGADPMFAYVADGFALRLVGGEDRSTFNGLDGQRDLAVNVFYTDPDPMLWNSVLDEIATLLTAWRIN